MEDENDYHMHSATSSTDSSFSTNSSPSTSYQLILEHVFQYPGTYEIPSIPLRTMYTINTESRIQQPPIMTTDLTSSDGQAANGSQRTAAQVATAQFSTSLVNHIARLPSQPCSLPPSFVTSFLLRSFPVELELVDFPQALTCLDYLRDLERRRRRETEASLSRIGIRPSSIGQPDDISMHHTGVAAWLYNVEKAEKKVEALYSQIYVGLRKWILINELSLRPFSQYNCMAMLNTLYPPPPSPSHSAPPSPTVCQTPNVSSTAPNPTITLTPSVLKAQRDLLFRWTRAVEKRGPDTLKPLMAPDRRHPHDQTGWPGVHETLDSYLKVANHIIAECSEVQGLEDFDNEGLKKNKKKDSGISFNSAGELEPRSVKNSFDRNKRLPSPPPDARSLDGLLGSKHQQSTPEAAAPQKGLSRLEKVARELRKIKITRGSNQRATSEEYDGDISSPGLPPNNHSNDNSDKDDDDSGNISRRRPASPHPRGHKPSPIITSRSEGRHTFNMRRSFSRNRPEAPMPSPNIEGMTRPSTPSPMPTGSKTLRKLRSLGDLKRPSTSCGEVSPAPEATFNKAEMLKAKAAWEAREAQREKDAFWMVPREGIIGMAH